MNDSETEAAAKAYYIKYGRLTQLKQEIRKLQQRIGEMEEEIIFLKVQIEMDPYDPIREYLPDN